MLAPASRSELADVEPDFVEWRGDDPIAYVVSCNLKRRHMNASQRAMAATDMLPMLEAEAKDRQRGHAGTAPGNAADTSGTNTGSEGDARDHAAEMFDVSPRYVSDAKAIASERPELAQEIRDGEKTIVSHQGPGGAN